nr:immunoglobulin heavy chain junction region [Macaca mulatta]
CVRDKGGAIPRALYYFDYW